ncbi:hypothetical protein MMC13_004620 [Lambiella insularis]|nr:hypothetical protein [Lambiella insularis]
MSTLTMTHACALVPTIDAHFLTRAWNWFEHLKATSPALAAGSFLIVELLQEAALTSAAPHATAWPHPTTQHHVLQFGVGYPTGMDCTEELALEMLQRGLQEVPLAPVKQGAFMPNFVERFMDVKKIYGANYGKLRLIKTKYDPRGRFNKGVFIPPYKESSFRLLGGISAKL